MASARVLSVKQLKQKKHEVLQGLPAEITKAFGDLPKGFTMIVYGKSGNGKTNLLIQFMCALAKVLPKSAYLGLEEGFGLSMARLVRQYISDEYSGRILFTDHEMTYDQLKEWLKTQRPPNAYYIDSLQYWNIEYDDYKYLKEKHPSRIFIYNSHSEGSKPKGATAKAIEYDAPIKVYVEGYIAFIRSRFGGSKIYVIWEEGARKYWGDREFEKHTGERKEKKKPSRKNEKEQNEKDSNNNSGTGGGNSTSVQPGGNLIDA